MKRVAYITTSFGALSQTFIRREVYEIRNIGLEIALFGVHAEIDSHLSDMDICLVKETDYIYPLRLWNILYANLWFIINRPAKYLITLRSAFLNEEKNIFQYFKLIYHFLVSAYMAFSMRKKDIAHIHSQFLNVPATIALYASGLLGVSYSISLRSGGLENNPSVIALRQKIKNAKFLFSVSNFNIGYYNSIIPCKEKTFLVRSSIPLDKYLPRMGRIFSKDGIIQLISIGRLVEKKGFIYIIEACKLLMDDKIEFLLTIIGDGPLDGHLKKNAKELGLQTKIVFAGSRSESEVKSMLGKSDICVVPSVTASTGEKEGIPNIIIEAMALKVPVVATDHAGISEIVRDRVSGILIREKDPKSISEAIKLLAKDKMLREGCVRNGRCIVEKYFDIKKNAGLKKKIFEENI